MTDEPSEYDRAHPSQAEGEDPTEDDRVIVLESEGEPSQAEGEDPDRPDAHEVIAPADPE